MLDLAIIGCGPAGLSAALNARARNKEFKLFGVQLCSPALHKAHRIDNFLGFPDIKGDELRQIFLEHARSKGIVPRLEGQGLVVSRQSPSPGAPWPGPKKDQEFILWLSRPS